MAISRILVLAALLVTFGSVFVAVRGMNSDARQPMHERLFPQPQPDGVEALPCPADPFVILTGGQSNSANHIQGQTGARPDLPAYMWSDGRCFPIADPLPGATGDLGSLWTELAQKLAERRERPILVIAAGHGATQFDVWSAVDSPKFARMRAATQAAAERGFAPNLILWLQGESDARNGLSEAHYTAGLDRLLARIDQEIPKQPNAHLILIPTSRSIDPGKDRNAQLRAAFASVTQRTDWIDAGPDVDALGADARWDRLHFNAVGRAAIVEQLLPQIEALME